MKPHVKTLLTEALLSGKYTQIRGALRTDDGFSVLGVLCDLYCPSGWLKNDPDGFKLYQEDGWYYQGFFGMLSPDVQEWSGTGMQGESWGYPPEKKNILNLGWLNSFMTFEEIAKELKNHESFWKDTEITSNSKGDQVNLFSPIAM